MPLPVQEPLGSSLQVSTSMANTRFNRLAQVIARDGMYAGFAGAKTGH
ncbi:MAG: hypothetical protein IID60_04685 [Proteobacteria bacterium]|nr:hypothetical protein [Pseudomonadota bacterium]